VPPPKEQPRADESPGTGAEAAGADQTGLAYYPGRFHVGPFYLTPLFRIGTLGLDSNVLYTPIDHQADFTGSGGPGLDVVLPLSGTSRLKLEGLIDYIYFARSDSLRKLNGSSRARLGYGQQDDDPPPDTFVLPPDSRHRYGWVEESYERTSSRINLELDARIPRWREGTEAKLLQPLLGRLSLSLGGGRSHAEVEPGAEPFLGTDLRRTMTRDARTLEFGLQYDVTPLTSLVIQAEGDYERFPLEATRNADIERVTGGVVTDPDALIEGHARVGLGRFRPKNKGLSTRQTTVADVDAMWNVSPRTRLGGGYRRDLGFTWYDTGDQTPLLVTDVVEARLERELGPLFDIRVFARRWHLKTDATITIVEPDGTTQTAARDDSAREGGLDFGYRIREGFRIGITASYTTRASPFDYFNIKGLVVGGTFKYAP
jgi:hypothetical protein